MIFCSFFLLLVISDFQSSDLIRWRKKHQALSRHLDRVSISTGVHSFILRINCLLDWQGQNKLLPASSSQRWFLFGEKKGALLLLIPVLTYGYHSDGGTCEPIPPFTLGVDSLRALSLSLSFSLLQKISFPFDREKNTVSRVFLRYRSRWEFPVYRNLLIKFNRNNSRLS